MNTQPLIATAPPELLLGLGIFFGISALILVLLAVEAGNYPEFRHWLRQVRGNRPWRQYRRRWWFNHGSPDRCSDCSARLTS